MKPKTANLIWGLILILAGGLFLAQNLGYLPLLSEQFLMIAFAGASFLFFVGYFVSGVRNWGLLFPACILGALAITLWMTQAGLVSPAIGVPVLAAIGIPFVVAFALDTRQNWWALIPAWVFAVLTLVVLISERVPEEVIGTVVLLAIALPFLLVYIIDRSHWWALIPGGVLAVLSIIPLLTLQTNDELIGSFVLLVIALPFFVVYFWSAKNWWALIPAGVLSSIAVSLLFIGQNPFGARQAALTNGVMFLGWALTFGVLWLRRSVQPTAWAIYPTVALAAAGILAFFLGANMNLFWPFILIAGGGLILFVTLRPKKTI